jgi:hypothetical protein
VSRIIAIKGSYGSVDLQTWQYFRVILEKLSIGGMSSEEATVDKVGGITLTVFEVKLCEWRAPEIDGMLSIIDKAGETVMSSRGSKAAPRVKSKKSGASGPRIGLPRKMYNQQWLEKMERERPLYVQDELRVSEEAFDLLMLATANV